MKPRRLCYRWFLAVLGAILILFLSVVGVQGGDPRGAWVSNAFQILNVEPFPQTFTARFLSPDGSVAGVMTDTLPAGAARFYPAETLPILPTFTGTLAVSAPGQVALEILHLGAVTEGNTILETVADEMIGTVAHTPIDRCTVLLIHNPSPTDVAIVDLRAFAADGTGVGMRTDYILPEGLLRVHPLSALGLPSDFAGSAVLQASRPIQVTVLSICGGLAAFVAPSEGSTRLFAPHLPPSIPGLVTATLAIRNTGTTVAEGEVIYAPGITIPLTLPPLGSIPLTSPVACFIYLPLVIKGWAAGGNAVFPAAAVPPPSYSAIISMTAPVAAVVQVVDARAGGGALAYRAFASERATPAVALPLLLAGYEGWWTGNRIWVRNMGEQTTDVQMRYVTVPTGTVVWGDLPGLGPGETVQVSMPPLPDGADRAAAIFLADQPIVALAGAFNVRPDVRDRHIRYPGTNFDFTCTRIAEADFTWSPLTPTVGQAVSFTGVVSPADATPPISFSWSFGDGTYGSGDYVFHTYAMSGTYVVAMTATNCLGFGEAHARYTLTVVPHIAPPQYVFSSYSPLPPIGPQPLILPTVFHDYYGGDSLSSVQNQMSTTVLAMVDFFQGGITPVLHLTSTIPAYTSWYLSMTLPSGLSAAHIQADGSFFAIDNQAGSNAAAAYHALPGGNSTLFCPELYYDYNGWNSSIDIYNPNQMEVPVSAVYSDGISRTAMLGPGAHVIFRQSEEGHLPGSRFAGMVTAENPITALCSQAHVAGGARLYEAAAGGFTTTYVPYLSKSGTDPALFVMNPGPAPVTATIAGSSVTIAPGVTWVENIFPPGYAGGTVVESTGEVIVLAYVDGPAGPGDPYSAYTVHAVPHSPVFFPYTPKNAPDQGYIWNAMPVIQNSSLQTATVQVTFYDELGNAYSPTSLGAPIRPIMNPFPLPGGASQQIFLDQTTALPDRRFSAVVTSDQPLVGMVLLWGYSPGLRAGGERAVPLHSSVSKMR